MLEGQKHREPTPRSLLITPGDQEGKLRKGQRIGVQAHLHVIDLEDSVGPDNKGLALQNAIQLITGDSPIVTPLVLRLNSLNPEVGRGFADDLRDLGGLLGNPKYVNRERLRLLMIPKVNNATEVRVIEKQLQDLSIPQSLRLIWILETAQAIEERKEIIKESRLACAILLGWEDLSISLGMTSKPENIFDNEALKSVATKVIGTAKASGLLVYDGVNKNIENPLALIAQSESMKAIGANGKLAIHPNQIPHINRAFRPSDSEVAWSRRIVDSVPENWDGGAFSCNGEMVERMHHILAMKILDEVKAIEAAEAAIRERGGMAATA
ncbi:MAG: CoA ester lyase [Patescibacteria group bacterium]